MDVLDKTISDIMQYNYESKDMLRNLIKDKSDNKLNESSLRDIVDDI